MLSFTRRTHLDTKSNRENQADADGDISGGLHRDKLDEPLAETSREEGLFLQRYMLQHHHITVITY